MFLNRRYNPPNYNDTRVSVISLNFKKSMSLILKQEQANRMYRNKELFGIMESEMLRLGRILSKTKDNSLKARLNKEFDYIAEQYAFQDGIDEDVQFIYPSIKK